MIEVDGTVASADDLIRRVEDLLGRLEAGDEIPGTVSPTGLPALVAPVHQMRALHSGMHPPEIPTGRGLTGRFGSLIKRTVRKVTAWYVEPRFQVQEQVEGLAVDFASEVYNNIHRIEEELDDLRRANIRTRLELVAAVERLRRERMLSDRLVATVDHLESVVREAAAQDDVRALRKEFGTMLDRLGAETVSGADIDYVEFERRFRGEPAEVALAQKRYLSLIPPVGEPGTVVDIGCGRGEMLAMLVEAGHEARGVDTDAGMVQACLDEGLDAVCDDGLHFLATTPPESLKGIFCAQVVEHLLTSELEGLVRRAFEALRPGGVLVVETINPRSSFALGNHFYADTSHVRPVHPETLRFICEQAGFSSVQLEERSPHPLLDLQDELPDDVMGTAVHDLIGSVFGYQDYVIIANK